MRKVLITIFSLFVFSVSVSFAASKTTKPSTVLKFSTKLLKDVDKPNEVYYIWTLYNDGCFYLYQVTVVGGILEFWEPMNNSNWATSWKNCMYANMIEEMC